MCKVIPFLQGKYLKRSARKFTQAESRKRFLKEIYSEGKKRFRENLSPLPSEGFKAEL